MFEEAQVCMLCGRPVDGRVYCSDECESLDAASPSLTSPSLSPPSSAYPSPYLVSTQVGLDVPALLPAVLGHRAHHSISSSTSSTGWSALTDQEDADAGISIAVVSANADQHLEMHNEGAKSAGLLHPHQGNGLSYARRPSSTNHRSIVPTLLRHPSGVTTNSSSSASSFGNGSAGLKGFLSPLYAAVIADTDDASSLCLSEDVSSELEHPHPHYGMLVSSSASTSTSASAAAAAARRKRNRASLPAYFSLLQGQQALPSPPRSATGTATISPASPRHWRTPSALQQQLSRSLQASPTTPRVAYATATFTHSNSNAVDDLAGTPKHRATTEESGRGRPRTRDQTRSASSRREQARSPSRSDRHHVHLRHEDQQPQQRDRMTAAQRARIDSVEKVAEWVSSSPVIRGYPRRTERRNSSPQRVKDRARYEFVEALARGLRGCAVASDDEESLHEQEVDEKVECERRGRRMSCEEDRGARGRRRVGELDRAVVPVMDAPGLGNGRSGLKSREGRGRERRR